jgi:hypothetical protein
LTRAKEAHEGSEADSKHGQDLSQRRRQRPGY